jgi:hypothetical protein
VSWKLLEIKSLSLDLEETKKGKVFGIFSHKKKLSKSNDVHAQDQTFLAVLLPLKIRVTEGGDIRYSLTFNVRAFNCLESPAGRNFFGI